MRNTDMNINGPERFQEDMKYPQYSGFVGFLGKVGSTIKKKDTKKETIRVIDAKRAALFFDSNFLTLSILSPNV